LLGTLRDQAAHRITTNGAAENGAKDTQDGVARRCRLACPRMVGGDVAGFMAKHEGQLGFVAHKPH
jgi:hypothetical protein